jgi:hypothetical protein
MPRRRKPEQPVPATDGEPIKRVFDMYAGRVEARDGEALRRLGQVLAGALMGSPAGRASHGTTGPRAGDGPS